MSLTSSDSIPPGWYPDPAGDRQWRVWTGTNWSEMTRPYGQPTPHPELATSLPLIRSLHVLLRYGIVATFAGLGLLTSVIAHWPGTAHPLHSVVAQTLVDTGVAMTSFGLVCYALAARELEGRWTLEGVLPGINVLAVGGILAQRLGGRSAIRRMVSETILLGLFIAQSHSQTWLAIGPMLIAVDHVRSVHALSEHLVGPSLSPSTAP